jgi:hypothetical protein
MIAVVLIIAMQSVIVVGQFSAQIQIEIEVFKITYFFLPFQTSTPCPVPVCCPPPCS